MKPVNIVDTLDSNASPSPPRKPRSAPWRIAGILAFLAVTWWRFILPSAAAFQTPDLKTLEETVVATIEKTKLASVAVQEADPRRPGFFSGVVVSPQGHVLSVGHAIRVGASYRVHFSDGRTVRGKGLGRNGTFDCAMIQISEEGNWPYLEIGESSSLQVDEPVIGLSHPGNYRTDRGLVIRFGAVMKPVTSRFGMIQTSVLMEPGDSGGPLVNLEGKVVGVHSQINQSLRENYEVGTDLYRAYWDALNQPTEFRVDRVPGLPYLGLELRRGRRSGGRVQSVDQDSPASRAGLQVGDIITTIEGNGRGISIDRIFDRFLQGDRSIDLKYQRNQEPLSTSLEITDDDLVRLHEHSTPLASAASAQGWKLPPLSRIVAPLEDQLDDFVLSIESNAEGSPQTILGLAIGNEGFVISKSSHVGDAPQAVAPNGNIIPLTIRRREVENDLVLLQASTPLRSLPDAQLLTQSTPLKLGIFLISPRPTNEAVVSVLGSRQFRVDRDVQNRGYLGVELEQEESGIYFREVFPNGAAQAAGFQPGDQLLQLGDLRVDSVEAVHAYLRQTLASQRVPVTVVRQGEPVSKTVVLGSVPTQHVADFFDGGKSPRRDGFESVFCHDAPLFPHECGGPLFDREGRLMGLNIARVSRTHCYAIPLATLAKFYAKRHEPTQPATAAPTSEGPPKVGP